MTPGEARMSGLGHDVRSAIKDWAQATPRVRRVWVIGSRAKGSERPDSDLDIAIEIEPVVDSEETLSRWMVKADEWAAQLQKVVGPKVDLAWFDPDGSTPKIQKALDDGAILIYDRAGTA
jgi:predicted nucleotidyltransferase